MITFGKLSMAQDDVKNSNTIDSRNEDYFEFDTNQKNFEMKS